MAEGWNKALRIDERHPTRINWKSQLIKDGIQADGKHLKIHRFHREIRHEETR